MTASNELLDPTAIAAVLPDLAPGWTGSVEGLVREIDFADFPTAVRFVDEIAAIAEERDHHPDLALSWRTITVTLVSHSAGGVTQADVDLAFEVDRIAAGLPQAEG